ncbi:MAG: VWA domain-containing protein [Kofleriaceae bacterium]
MKLGLVFALAVLTVGCGPSTGGDDEGPGAVDDADGDGISDADEGRGTGRDTDGDGTADYLDDDSDNDGIPDYREAGDSDPRTPPVDSDLDGKPDFIDLDSDDNGREDSLDGTGDTDNDGIGDWADLDDDNDAIMDIDELGPNPAQPLDTDGDGTADFRDTDSDNDTIPDLFETSSDYDGDGVPNFRDLDSDDDCIPDQIEARGTPPVDSDNDGRPDFVDRDSDNDGVADREEDANCNGVIDVGESSPVNGDTDGDGVSDLVEIAAGTDPTNPASNPQANGDFVFIEPFEMPQSPADQNLDFSTKLQAIDLYVLLDRSGSMSTEITTVRNNLSAVVANLKCPPGVTTNCIPDLWAGAATIGYAGSGAEAFRNYVDIQPTPNFSVLPITEPSGCCAEPLNYAAHASITGLGSAGFGFGSVPARATCFGSPAATAGYATFGYPCFRQTALPVVMMATDEPPISAGDTDKRPDWDTIVKPQYVAKKARLVGIYGDSVAGNTINDLKKMATDTAAIDATMGNAPLVFSGAGTNAAAAIQQGILALANGLPLDINAVSADDPSDSVDAIAAFVDHLETLQLGTAQCANGLNDIDTNGDSYDDKFLQVRTGTPVCWKVVSKKNTTVPATDEPQLFRATISVYGDGVTQLDKRNVFFLVPPVPLDGPIQ